MENAHVCIQKMMEICIVPVIVIYLGTNVVVNYMLKMIKVNFKKLVPEAVVPTKSHFDDFAYDLVATSKEEIAPGVFKYGTGLALQLVPSQLGDTIPCFSIRPRSSVWKTGLVLANAVPTIDVGYTGEIMLVFYKAIANGEPYNVGDRIGQLYFDYTVPIEFNEVKELQATERGEGGFGSTGK